MSATASSPITTHVLDTALGRPAAGVPITLEVLRDADWHPVGVGATDVDGRLRTLLPAGALEAATYRITFDTAAYFGAARTPSFYPTVQIVFVVADRGQHYHVPLLISPFGYATYRGS
jgi:5-hydroxyisourate hydrolase